MKIKQKPPSPSKLGACPDRQDKRHLRPGHTGTSVNIFQDKLRCIGSHRSTGAGSGGLSLGNIAEQGEEHKTHTYTKTCITVVRDMWGQASLFCGISGGSNSALLPPAWAPFVRTDRVCLTLNTWFKGKSGPKSSSVSRHKGRIRSSWCGGIGEPTHANCELTDGSLEPTDNGFRPTSGACELTDVVAFGPDILQQKTKKDLVH